MSDELETKSGARHSKADNDVLKRMRARVKDMASDLDEVGAPGLDEPKPEQDAALDCVAPGQIINPETKSEAVTLVHSGGSVKALGDGKLGGYLVVFGDPNHTDLEGDYFTDQTDFGDATETDVYYHHGLDKSLGPRVIGKATLKRDSIGIWMDAQLSMRDAYERAVYKMGEDGKLGLSSGTAAHLVIRERVTGKASVIKKWPLGLDGSFTPTPAEPRTFATPLKSLKATTDLLPEDASHSGGSTASDTTESDAASVETQSTPALPHPEGNTNMDTNVDVRAEVEKILAENAAKAAKYAEAEAAKQAEIKAAVEAERAKIEAELKTSRKGGYMGGQAPATKRVSKVGFSNDDTASMMHWLATGDVGAVKAALQEDTDSEGGYVVPDGFYARIAEKLQEKSVVRAAGATVIQTSLKMTEFPAENASATVTLTAEEAAYTQSEPTLQTVQVTNYKAAVVMKISEELLADAAANLEMFVTNQIVNRLALWENTYFVAGTGTGQPRGALTASSAGVTTAGATAITPAEFINLVYSLGDRYADNASIITRRATVGYLRGLSSANQFLFNKTPQGNGSGGGDGGVGSDEVLYGLPVFQTAQIAAIATAVKSILIGDFSQYVITENGGLVISRNPYLYQANGQVGIFASKRMGGNALLDEAFKHMLQA